MEREHAREAIRLLKRERPKVLKKLQRTDSEIVHLATEIALGLQKGQFPDWYKQLEHDLKTTSLHKTHQKENSTSSSQSEQEDETDEYVEDESIESSSSNDDEKGSSTAPTELEKTSGHTKWNRNRMSRSKLLSVRILMKSVQRIQDPAVETRTLPSSGIITAKSPSPNLELPLIHDSFRRSVTFSSIKRSKDRRNKLPSSAIEFRSEKYSSPPEKNEKRMETRMKRRKYFGGVLDSEMETPKISSEYWKIPFDPLRECVLTDQKIFKMDKSESENEQDISLSKNEVQVHTDFWEIRKIMRFIRIGNPTATVLALCALKELDIQKPSSNEIIRHLHGIPLFLNILDTDNSRCRVAALKVLVCLANSPKTSEIISKRGGIQQLVLILSEDDKVVVSLACDVLSLMAKHSNVRMLANKMNIVEKLMLVFKACTKKALRGKSMKIFYSVCNALWSCCLLAREKDVRMISESLHVISRMVETLDEELIVPMLGIVEECASFEYFRGKMEKENFIEKVIWKLKSNERTKLLCVKILFKCSSDERSQKTLLKSDNIQEIMKLFKQNCEGSNDELLTLLLGIIWRCSLYGENRKKFENYGVFSLLSNILNSHKTIQVKSAALGVLSELLWDEADTDSGYSHEVMNHLIDFMSLTEPAMLVHSARSLGVWASHKAWRKMILKLDGLRLLWSLLKRSDEEVIASGAVALASVCAYPEESANAVRSIVGGIELLMTLLASTDLAKCNLLICLCEAAVSIAKDAENRSILLDYDLIPVIFKLCEVKSKILRYYVTCLISRCCESLQERTLLSRSIPYLTEGLGDKYDEQVHCASICALSKLSRDFENCALLRENGRTKILMNLLASSNERIQDAAAECLSNVRKSMTCVG